MFSGLSIRNKLVIIILIVAFVSTALGFTFVIISDIRTFKENMVDNTVINARLIGEYSVTPLVFNDRTGAEDILKKLQAIPQMANGHIYDDQGRLFASYSRNGEDTSPPELSGMLNEFRDKHLHVVNPIIYKGNTYGQIYLRASTDMLNEKIRKYLFTMLFLICGIMFLSYFLALKLQKLLSGPILDLTGITRKITDEGDYSLRIDRKGSDEIALLYDSFNDMLTQVNIREADLLKEKDKLRKYLDTSAVIVVIIDAEQNVSLINRKGCETLGYSEVEIVGSNWFENYLPLSEKDRTKEVFVKIMSGDVEPVEHYENYVLTRDGDERLIAWYNTALRDSKGNIIATMSSGADITDRKRAENQIKASLHEKELLLREVHHRVKNNMQVISSLLSLQADQITDSLYVDKFNDSKNRIKSMALVHEKLYRSEDMANIDFEDYINTLSRNLLSFYDITAGEITLMIHAESVSLGIDAAIPCGLLINELLSNCLKHAFPDKKGEITVDFRKTVTASERPEYSLIISDNGIGIPEHIDVRNTTSLGLQLITTLVEHQLQGTLDLDRSQGTRFHIRFRELQYRKRT